MFSAIPLIFFPILLWTLHQRCELTQRMEALGHGLRTFDVLAGSGFLLVLAIIFSIALWLNIRTLSQK